MSMVIYLNIVMKHPMRLLIEQLNEDAIYAYDESFDSRFIEMTRIFKSKKYKTQPWKTVPFHLVERIWKQYATLNMIRDEKQLDNIGRQIVFNIIDLHINTVMIGHTQHDPNDRLENENMEMSEDELDEYSGWIVDPKFHQWRISDYQLDRLIDSAIKIISANTAEEKLVAIDTVFSLAHQRSDLSSLFITGGAGSLDLLAS